MNVGTNYEFRKIHNISHVFISSQFSVLYLQTLYVLLSHSFASLLLADLKPAEETQPMKTNEKLDFKMALVLFVGEFYAS